MIPLRLYSRIYLFVAFAAIWGSIAVTRAEQPAPATPPPAESKTAPPPRAKPQVIYHLPRSSTYAATLHSQAKGSSNALPIDSSMPTSLQMSRAAANEEAARAKQESAAAPSNPDESAAPAESPRQRTVKRSKIESNRPQVRSHPAPRNRGPGNSQRNKSRKK